MSNTNQELGVAGRIVRLFLSNRELSILTIIVLTGWGLLSFILMPKQYNPEIVAPAFTITTTFPEANSEEVYELITRPLEDKIAELPGIDEIMSESRNGGLSIVTVKFFVGSDQEAAKISLNQKLRDNIAAKPASAGEPLIQSIDPDDVPILDIGLSSPDLSESSLRKLAFDVADELKQAEGVSKYEISGGRTNHLQVELDADKLRAEHIDGSQVIAAIRAHNDIFTTNTLRNDERAPIVNVSGNIADADTLQQIVLRRTGDHILRLGDVANVNLGPGTITDSVSLRNGTDPGYPVVHIALSKLKGTNATDVSDNIREHLETLQGSMIPTDVETTILNDEGKTANDEISKLTFDLIKSIVIVGILLAVFLGLRNALIASISIPLVLLAVFGMGLLAGETVNRITLFALILSLGLLVDDAIVVVENIARYFRLYPEEKKMALIIRAVDEVGGALTLSTFTMALAFLPMAFVTGMMGPYMGPIPFFVPVALLASLVFSLTLNPFLALLFSKKESGQTKPAYENGRFFRGLRFIEARYASFLARLLASPKQRNIFLGTTLGALIISLILPLSPLVPFRMLPKADKDQFFLYLDLPENTSLMTTSATVHNLETLIASEPGVTTIETFIGQAPIVDFNGLFKGSAARVGEHQATLKVHLTPHTERDRMSEDIALSLRHRADTFLDEFPDATLRFIEDPPGPPVLATLLIKVKGGDTAGREAVSQDIEALLSETAGVVDIETSLPDHVLGYTYAVDHEQAGLLGIAPQTIAATLSTALSGTPVGLYHETGSDTLRKPEQEYIIVRFRPEDRAYETDLNRIELLAADGRTVPLLSVLEKTDQSLPETILSDERERTLYLSGEMEGRSVVYAVLDLFSALRDYRLADGQGKLTDWSLLGFEYTDQVGERYSIEIGGEWKLTLEVFRDLGLAMAVAIFLIYFVLAAKTESLFISLLIMVSIPLGLIGVLPGFAVLQIVKGTYFNATSMIGVIALAGLAVKNAVIYLEYLEPLKRSGTPIAEALIETGRIRLLPIVLTSLAAILGSFTIASDPVWEGLAWAIIFGLAASTFLTLLVFPVLYYLAERRHWEQEK